MRFARFWPAIQKHFRALVADKWLVLLFATWGVWFLILWPQWFLVNDKGISTSHIFIWGDWAAHLSFVNHFRWNPPTLWWQNFPILATAPFVYPPLSSLVSAGLMCVGFSLKWAMVLPGLLGCWWLLYALYRWFRGHDLDGRWAYLGLSAVLLSASWGWLRWVQLNWLGMDVGSIPVANFPQDFYSKDFEGGLVWVNPVASMLLPQRSFILGFPLLLTIAYRLQQYLKHRRSNKDDVSTGIVLGSLTFFLWLAHAHSVVGLALLCAVWALLFVKAWKLWVSFALTAGTLIIPWVWTVWGGMMSAGSLSLNVGWMAPEPFTPWGWLEFWFWNWGLLVPTLMIAFGWLIARARKDESLRFWLRWFAPFGLLFVLANIVQFQPWEWDNTKIFFITMIGLVPLVLMWWRHLVKAVSRNRVLTWTIKGVGAGVVALHMLTGLLDLSILSSPESNNWTIANADEVAFAQRVRERVPVGNPVLTASAHNHPVSMLSGRSTVLGFQGWLWSYGLDVGTLPNDVRVMYGDTQEGMMRRAEHNVRYVVISPAERYEFPERMSIEQDCAQVERVGEYELYDCSPVTN